MGDIPSNIRPSTTLGDVVLMCLGRWDMPTDVQSLITEVLVIHFGDDAWNKRFDQGMVSVMANGKTVRYDMAQVARNHNIDKSLCSYLACTLERTFKERLGEATGGGSTGFTESDSNQ